MIIVKLNLKKEKKQSSLSNLEYTISKVHCKTIDVNFVLNKIKNYRELVMTEVFIFNQ